MWIASKPVTAGSLDTSYDHLYYVYDPDGDPTSGDEKIFRAGPKAVGIIPKFKIEIEVWVDINVSEDNLESGQNPYADRNYTEVASGTAATDLRDDVSNWADGFGTPDVDGKIQTDVPYTSPIYDANDLRAVPALNSNTTIVEAGRAGGLDVPSNMPFAGGNPTNGRMSTGTFAGWESTYTAGNQTVDTDLTQDRIIYDVGGDTTIDVNVDSFGTGRLVVRADTDSGTLDRINLKNVAPENVQLMRTLSGDLHIYLPGDPPGRPSIIVPNQWQNGVAQLDQIRIEPLSGTPVVIPLADKGDVPLLVPASIPGFVDDCLDLWGLAQNTSSPLIIDIDLDGVELTTFDAATTATFFDIDGDGFAEQTAWVGADDGLLVRDLDESGTIDSVAELFGSPTVDGFALLATLDDNGDHVIDQYDDAWSDLVVWKDANGDAVTQSGELHSLASLGIVSFDLAGVAASTATISGNPISHTSTYRLSSGTTGAVADAWFVHDNVNSSYTGDYSLDMRALFLPTLRGFGELPDLHISMSMDEDLLNLVLDFASNWDISRLEDGAALDSDVQDILWQWAGVQDVLANSRGQHVDARKLEFLEAYFGSDYLQIPFRASNPAAFAGAALEDVWDFVLANLKAQLMLQVGANVIFEGAVTYNAWSGEIEGVMGLSQDAVDDLEAAAPSPGAALELYWQEVAQFLEFTKGLANLDSGENTIINDAIVATDNTLTWTEIKTGAFPTNNATLNGTSGADTITGDANNDTIYGNNGDDTLDGATGHDSIYGGAGNDTIYGGVGNDYIDGGDGDDMLSPGAGGNTVFGGNGHDTYIFAGGDDVYSEYAKNGTDTIILPLGITANDLTFFRSAPFSGPYYNHLTVNIGTLGTIELENYFYYGRALQSSHLIETFTFSDSSTASTVAFTDLVSHGSAGSDYIQGVILGTLETNDTIYGYAGDDQLFGNGGNDILDGGSGNDKLHGGSGDDIYIASPGFDEILENGGSDTIRLPEGFDIGDVSFLRQSGSPTNLLITIDGLGQILVKSQFSPYSSNHVETLDFAGASAISLTTLSIESIGTSANDTIAGITGGASTNDIIDGGFGNDILQGNAGDDTYFFSAGTDTIYESLGTDVLAFRDGIVPGQIAIYRDGSANQSRNLVVEDGLGNKTIVHGHFYSVGSSIESLVFADSTTWTLSGMEIETRGTSGNDVIYAHAYGDASTNDTVYGYAGNDQINGGNGDDVLYGGDGNDTLSGQNDNDSLHGEYGDDSLVGGAGNDWLYGGLGADNLKGDGGDDTFVWTANEGNDVAEDSGGNDNLHIIGGYTINEVVVVNEGSYHAKVTVSGETGQLVVEDLRSHAGVRIETILFDDGFATDLTSYNSWLKGTSSNDIVAGSGSDNTLIGYAGHDTMTGGAGHDDMHGGAGNDTLEGEDGNDLLYGGDGDDTLYGGAGLDTMHGGAGADTFAFETASAFGNVDVIRDFSTTDNDVIDLIDILGTVYDPLNDAIADFVQFTESGGSTFVEVDRDGTGSTYSFAQIAKLDGVTGLAAPDVLESNGQLIAA